MVGQTAEDIRDNIVKIADGNGNCVGTGFFIHKEYCVTCHHNICRLDEIYVEREENIETREQKKRYHAEWIEKFSDMQKDIAFLRVHNADVKPLEYRRETYGNIPVVVRGFPFQDLYTFPFGRDERGTLTDILQPFRWKEEEIVAEFEDDKKKKWNTKPEVNIPVYAFNGKFFEGFSGAPVCYQHDWKIVGMFEAKDDYQGYIIPMYVVVEKFYLEQTRESVSAPLPSLSTEAVIKSGLEYYYKKEYVKAIEQYDVILNDRNYTYAWNNKGIALAGLGRYEEAIKCYDRVLELEPSHVNVLNNKGSALDSLGRYEEAIKCYDRVLELEPNRAVTWCDKGNTVGRLGRYKEATKYFDKSLELEPNSGNAWYGKGSALAGLGRYEEAIKCYDRVLELEPNNPAVLNNKALYLDSLGRYEEAIKCYDRVLELEPNWAVTWYNKGIALAGLGRYEEAIKCYDRVLELEPNSNIWSNKGSALDSLGRHEEAIKCYDKAQEKIIDKSIEQNPDNAGTWYTRAWYKVKKGDTAAGLADLKKAIEIDKEFAQIAKENKDFDSIRNDYRFRALIKK